MSTIKRYWSSAKTSFPMSKEEANAWSEVDHKLTPDDVIQMQKIDADCNDCIHFKRGQMFKSGGMTGFRGTCMKFSKPMNAWPMQYSGHECFKHRRDAE